MSALYRLGVPKRVAKWLAAFESARPDDGPPDAEEGSEEEEANEANDEKE